MIATQTFNLQTFLLTLVALSSLVCLTSCQAPILGVGHAVEPQPVQSGVRVAAGAEVQGEPM